MARLATSVIDGKVPEDEVERIRNAMGRKAADAAIAELEAEHAPPPPPVEDAAAVVENERPAKVRRAIPSSESE